MDFWISGPMGYPGSVSMRCRKDGWVSVTRASGEFALAISGCSCLGFACQQNFRFPGREPGILTPLVSTGFSKGRNQKR
jgi:hypothetical protein